MSDKQNQVQTPLHDYGLLYVFRKIQTVRNGGAQRPDCLLSKRTLNTIYVYFIARVLALGSQISCIALMTTDAHLVTLYC